MQRSLAAMAASGLPIWYAQELFAAQEKKAADDKKPVDANDKIIMGAIGIGPAPRRGRDLFNAARNQKGVQYLAVCDVDKSHREFGAKEVGADCKQYEDFRQLLDNKDINAVTIAVPDHWHALIAIEAMKRGKDVYCEKPLALTIGEGRAIATVQEKTGRIFQTGSQQRTEFGGRFRLAARLVRAGRLGKIKTIETRIGENPTSPSIPKAEVPEGLNWDLWLGPAPKVDYCILKEDKKVYTRCHYEFRWWYEYSGGKMTDWGAHHNDIAQWALDMDKSGPIEVEGKGDSPSKEPNSYNCHPHFTVNYTYANGTKLICSDSQRKDSPDPHDKDHTNGVLFVGEEGKWLFVSRGKIEASDKAIIDEKLPDSANKLNEATSHMGNFIECVRAHKPTVCPPEVGHRSATVCHIGVIATRLGKKLKWDPVKERFHDEEADKWLLREFRKPWKLEV
jgi:predicted dehydrogenase